MNLTRYAGQFCAYGALLLQFAACSTPQPVRDLAERTAANVGVLGVQMQKLAADSAELSESRAATIARLHAANAQLRASYNFDLALTKKSGKGKDLELIKVLEDWHKEADAIHKAVDEEESKRKSAILSGVVNLEVKAEALKVVAGRLAKLAEDEPTQSRVRFLAGFLSQVRKDIDKKLAEENESATNAKNLIKYIGGGGYDQGKAN